MNTKMLQMVLDGQVSIKKEIKKNGKRIDKLGQQLAYLEDVGKLETQVTSN